MDQPYCVTGTLGGRPNSWACLVTATKNTEGGAGEGVFALVSSDGGATWGERPVPLEPEASSANATRALANSYATVVASPGGERIFAMYTMNVHNVTALPSGAPLRRSDELGEFVMKWSDDGGRSWSAERVVVPYRETGLDRNNSFAGKVKQMWCVDQTKVVGGTTYVAFTKIGSYIQNPPEEVFILSSPNLLTDGVANASAATWNLLPDGDVGLLPPGVAGPGDRTQVFEEGHVVPLNGGRGWYAVARTVQGFLAAAQTADPAAATGWGAPAGAPTTYAQYFDPVRKPDDALAPLPGLGKPAFTGAISTGVKNPRGPITPRRISSYSGGEAALLPPATAAAAADDADAAAAAAADADADATPSPPARYLMLFYNNAGGGYVGRDPYWLTAGIEAKVDAVTTVLWSQPEVALYDRDIHTGTSGGGYPDIIENATDGRIFISCTTKYLAGGPTSKARLHQVDGLLVDGLMKQHLVSTAASGRVALAIRPREDAGRQAIPLAPGVLLPPAFRDPPNEPQQGFAVDLVVDAAAFDPSNQGTLLLAGSSSSSSSSGASGQQGGAAAQLQVTVSRGGGLRLTFSSNADGGTGAPFDMSTDGDATCSRLLRSKGLDFAATAAATAAKLPGGSGAGRTTATLASSHFVAVNVDAGPALATVMVDGVLCDGGAGYHAKAPFSAGYGWQWVNTTAVGSLAPIRAVSVGARVTGGGHVYGRSLRTSELVGNFRAALHG
eukprot:g2132.t1